MAGVNPGGAERRGEQSQSSAFVLFRQNRRGKGELSYNEKAQRILTFSLSSPEGGSDPLSEISAYCSKWAKTIERGPDDNESGAGPNPEAGFIDIIQSGCRRYGVRAVVLAGQRGRQRQYLFILERTSVEGAHLEVLFRHYHLNKREKEVVRLLLAGNSNKEMADSLGLTLNTVKGYMKLLTRKLGVSGRSGIVAAFLDKK
jgi:DNA-binding CsgD family transcriptional regulator